MSIIFSVIVLGILGIIFGAILAYASQRFAVEQNPKVEIATNLLPGANCGGCGYPGCAGLAAAIVEKGVSISTCPVLSPEARKKLAQALGLDEQENQSVQKVAQVMCNGLPEEEYKKFNYKGLSDCQAAILVSNGPWLCPHRCVGEGTCAKVCPFNAITMGQNKLPIIDKEKCTGCGKCLNACPKNIIRLVDKSKTVHIKCNSPEKGVEVRKVCKVGCIGCGLCKKVCAYDAVIFENNLAKIDYNKCVMCGACVAKCPQKTIIMETEPNFVLKKALIDEELCIGCTICYKVCKFGAIEGGVPKQKHKVIQEKCIGCQMCVSRCPKKCISLKPTN